MLIGAKSYRLEAYATLLFGGSSDLCWASWTPSPYVVVSFSVWSDNETVETNESANAGSLKVRLSQSQVEDENDDESENDSRTYQIPMTFHQRPPTTSQMRRLMTPVSAPNFHQVPSST